jgi:hypothetical protein
MVGAEVFTDPFQNYTNFVYTNERGVGYVNLKKDSDKPNKILSEELLNKNEVTDKNIKFSKCKCITITDKIDESYILASIDNSIFKWTVASLIKNKFQEYQIFKFLKLNIESKI